MSQILILHFMMVLCSLAHTAAHAVAGWAAGLSVEEVNLFMGATLVRVSVGDTLYVVKLVPAPGGYIKFREKSGLDEFSLGFNDLHPVSRMLVIAAGPLVLFAVAVICLGPVHGVRSTWHGFREIVAGALAPAAVARPLVRSLLRLIRDSPVLISLGIVAAKMTAFNLLPLPPLDGGQILWTLIDWRGRFSERVRVGINYVGIFVTLILPVQWLFAVAWVVFHR